MHLGEVMRGLEHDGDAAAALAALGDIVLLAEVQAMATAYDEEPGEYVANASRRFALSASDETWLALMTAMERAADPGKAAVAHVLRWALAADARTEAGEACSCGGQGACHGGP